MTSGSQGGTFTAHSYDPAGNRIQTEVFIGLEASGEPYEVQKFSYYPDGLPNSQDNYYKEGLDSRILFRYDGQGRLDSKVVTGSDGVERFRDVFGYDGLGRVVEESRWKGEVLIFKRRREFASDGTIAKDTLFETEGPVLVAVQATVHGAGRIADEKRESGFRKQGGVWYHVLDTFRLYRQGLLVSSAAYEVGGKRLDSSAIAYDGNGNRILEERFNGSGLPMSRSVLAWKDLQSASIRRVAARSGRAGSGPVLMLYGQGVAGWRHLGLDLMGREQGSMRMMPYLRVKSSTDTQGG